MLFFLVQLSLAFAVEIFVSNSGSGSGNSLGDPTSLSSAIARADAGDLVHIAPGLYSTTGFEFTKSGTAANPIHFRGYRLAPNDTQTTTGPIYKYPDPMDASFLPLIRGTWQDDRGVGTGVTIRASHLILENLQIDQFRDGLSVVLSSVTNNVFRHIIVGLVGNFALEDSLLTEGNSGFENYAGVAMAIRGSNSKVLNSVVRSPGVEGIKIIGVEHEVAYSHVYGDDVGLAVRNAIDYYLLLTGATNCYVHDNYVERVGNIQHFGHGLVLKGINTGNLCEDNMIVNTNLELQFLETRFNTLRRCHVRPGVDRMGDINVANGANNNLFDGCTVIGARSGATFRDWTDGGAGDATDLVSAGYNNRFVNCIFQNLTDLAGGPQKTGGGSAINFHYYTQQGGESHNNSFVNCDFVNLATIFQLDRVNTGTTIVNSYFSQINEWSRNRYGDTLGLAEFRNNYLDNIAFSVPSQYAAGNTIATAAAGKADDCTLAPNSPLIDAGSNEATAEPASTFDYHRVARPQGAAYDIGACEYSATPPPTTATTTTTTTTTTAPAQPGTPTPATPSTTTTCVNTSARVVWHALELDPAVAAGETVRLVLTVRDTTLDTVVALAASAVDDFVLGACMFRLNGTGMLEVYGGPDGYRAPLTGPPLTGMVNTPIDVVVTGSSGECAYTLDGVDYGTAPQRAELAAGETLTHASIVVTTADAEDVSSQLCNVAPPTTTASTTTVETTNSAATPTQSPGSPSNDGSTGNGAPSSGEEQLDTTSEGRANSSMSTGIVIALAIAAVFCLAVLVTGAILSVRGRSQKATRARAAPSRGSKSRRASTQMSSTTYTSIPTQPPLKYTGLPAEGY